MGERLAVKGEDYFYDIRERFNRRENSIYFLFLNRSCFNGLMRFNGSGKFNVPFGKKPKRFSKSYITKIVNQADRLSKVMADKDWTFIEADWRVTLEKADPNDFVYLDPPYVGRNADYFNKWHEQDAIDLSIASIDLPCKYALSMWLENKYRKNIHLDKYWSQTQIKTFDHFYHVGSSESLRNEMKEALALSKSRRRARQFVQ
jgi:DNA adenine methylase